MNKIFLSAILTTALLAGCAHPDGRQQAQAAQSAITRSDAATVDADEANTLAREEVGSIDSKVVRLLNSR